jgi:hypothetical protein
LKILTLIVPFNGDLYLFQNNLKRFVSLRAQAPFELSFILVIDNSFLVNEELKNILTKEEFVDISSRLKVVRPTTKLGQMTALILGMYLSDRGAALLMSDDNKEPEPTILEMFERYTEKEISIIGSARVLSAPDSISRKLYYTIMGIGGLRYPADGFDSVLLVEDAKRKLLDTWTGEQFLQRLVIKATANKYETISYQKGNTMRKNSGWTSFYKIRYLITGLDESFKLAITFFVMSLIFLTAVFHLYPLSIALLPLYLSWKWLASGPYVKYRSASDINYTII